jgi:hypothetical protein
MLRQIKSAVAPFIVMTLMMGAATLLRYSLALHVLR